MTIPDEIPAHKPSPLPTRGFVLLAAVFILFGLLLQVRCLIHSSNPKQNYQKVIDDNQLIYSIADRGCGDNPIDCFNNPVFQIYYRPLFTATFSLQDRLLRKPGTTDYEAGRDTRLYHLENLILHAAVCVLAFWFFLLLFRQERIALLAGIVFTLHPLQVSVTTFIGGRPDSMALLFLLLFAIGAIQAAQAASSPARRLSWFLLSLFGYTCAVFTKEQCISMLLTLPFLLLHGHAVALKLNSEKPAPLDEDLPIDGIHVPYIPPTTTAWNSPRNRPWLWLNLLYPAPVALYVYAARRIIPFNTESSYHAHMWSPRLHLEMVGRTCWYFERLLLAPDVRPIHQSTLGPWDIPQFGVAVTGYLLLLLWLGVSWRVRRNPTLRFCMLWTSLTLFPCLNIVPIPSQFASCYRAVIPLLGFAGLLGAALDRLFTSLKAYIPQSDRQPFSLNNPVQRDRVGWQFRDRRRYDGMAWSIVLILIIYYSCETVADVATWRNNETLMVAELKGDPNFSPAYQGLGFWSEATGDWPKVEANFDLLLSTFMPTPRPGESFKTLVESPECQRALWSHAGLRYHPTPYILWILPHRGWAKQSQGHFKAAAADYRLVLQLNPVDNNSRANLYACYMSNGQVEEAAALYPNAGLVPARQGSGTGPNTP